MISIIINDPVTKYANTVSYATSATYATYAGTASYADYVFHASSADFSEEAETATLAGEVPNDPCCYDEVIDPVDPVTAPDPIDPVVTPPPTPTYYDAYYQVIDTCIPTTGIILVTYTFGACIVNYLQLSPSSSNSQTWEFTKNPTLIDGYTSAWPACLSFAKLQAHVRFASSDADINSHINNYYKYSITSSGRFIYGSNSYSFDNSRYYIYSIGKLATTTLYCTPSPAWAGVDGNNAAAVSTSTGFNCLGPPGCRVVSDGSNRYMLSMLTLGSSSYPDQYSSYMFSQFTCSMGEAVAFGGPLPKAYGEISKEERIRLFNLAIQDDISEMNLRKDIREISCNKKYFKADGSDFVKASIKTNKESVIWFINNKSVEVKTKDGISEVIIKSNFPKRIIINIMQDDVIYNHLEIIAV